MASELRYLQQPYAEATFDRTWQGLLFVLMHHATGFYCIFRTLVVRFSRGNACTHVLLTATVPFERLLPTSHPTNPSGDPESAPDLRVLESMLVLLVPHSSSPITEANITYATRQANLVLVGTIITSSIQCI